MENIQSFLNTSSINGLNHISSTQNLSKLFWIFVVFIGFTLSGVLIHQSFEAWKQSPISTTIESVPIAEITFPKVTVCPPKNTYTNLNYDLMRIQNMTLDNETRYGLSEYAVELLNDYIFDEKMNKLSKIQDDNRYYNWYHGYSSISLPKIVSHFNFDIDYSISTTATFGSISTQDFGENFDADKMDRSLKFTLDVNIPPTAQSNPNITLIFEVEKVSMKDLSKGKETFYLDFTKINADVRMFSQNFNTPYNNNKRIVLMVERTISEAETRRVKMNLMPGFNITWYYTGGEVETFSRYYEEEYRYMLTREFVRNNL